MNSAGSKVLQASLLFVLIFSPVFLGSVHAWSAYSFGVFLFFIFFLFPEASLNFQALPLFFKIASAGVFIFLFLQAFLFSQNQWLTQAELLKWLACGAFFLLIQSLPGHGRQIFLKTVICITFCEAVYGIIQAKTGYERVLWRGQETHAGFATGTFLNRSQLAGLLEMGMGVLMGYVAQALQTRRHARAVFLSALFFVLFTALIMSGSRMGLISFLSSACVFLLFQKEKFSAGLLLIVFLGAGAAAFWAGHEEFLARFSQIQEAWGGRPQAWKDTLKMILDNVWLGTGLGTYSWVFPQYQSASLLMGWTHAHQDYLELASGLGLPAFILWAGGVLIFFLQSVRKTGNPVLRGTACGLFSFLIHGLTDFNWAVPALAFWFFGLLSVLFASSCPPRNFPELKPFARALVRTVCCLLIFFAAQKAWAQSSPHARFALGKSLYLQGKAEEAREVFKKLAHEFPEHGKTWIYLGLLSGDSHEMKRNFSQGLKLEPGSAWNLYITSSRLLARPEELSGPEKQQAIERLKTALTLHYQDQSSPYLKSAMEVLWNSTHDFETLMSAVPADYLSPRLRQANELRQAGEIEKAREILRPALQEENPDMREILLLQKIEAGPEVDAKLSEIKKLYGSYAFYGFKDRRSLLWLNLVPGKTEVKILLKSPGAHVKFYLWEGRYGLKISSVYVTGSKWQLVSLSFTTSGGGRLLTMELADGETAETGPMKIKTVS